MPLSKDSQYWKVYNQKRKEYLSQKKRESRAKLKGTVVDQLAVVDHASVVDIPEVVDQLAVVDQEKVVDHPILTKLIQQWQASTNYNCASTCAYSYCNNCWYFIDEQLVNYKGL